MTDGNIIETAGLKKQYQDVTALDGLNLTVPSGSIVRVPLLAATLRMRL